MAAIPPTVDGSQRVRVSGSVLFQCYGFDQSELFDP